MFTWSMKLRLKENFKVLSNAPLTVLGCVNNNVNYYATRFEEYSSRCMLLYLVMAVKCSFYSIKKQLDNLRIHTFCTGVLSFVCLHIDTAYLNYIFPSLWHAYLISFYFILLMWERAFESRYMCRRTCIDAVLYQFFLE